MRPAFADVDDVFTYIQSNIRQTMFRGEQQHFLRKSAFDEITTRETVHLVASEDEDLFMDEKSLDQFVDRIFKDGKRLFATCVQGSLPMTCLQLLLENGLTDSNMPLSKEDFPGKKLKRNFVGSFLPNQTLFNVAFFELDEVQDLTGLTKPIDHDENRLIGKGAFGAVYTIQIHSEQRSFTSGNIKDEFAMKVTERKGTRELPYHQAMADLSHPHLVKCLTSFTFGAQYHMVYEKADRNLEEFMAKHKDPSTLPSVGSKELAQQLLGIIGAVSVIHNQSSLSDDTNRLSVASPASRKTGYLHDIKPDNLLVFKYHSNNQDYHLLRLSDFSCAKVVAFVESVSGVHRQSWQSTSKSGTPVYRPPESTTKGKTSRPYDIWSLGCVLLEVLVWFTEGYEGLESFRTSRFRAVKPNGIEDEGFYYTEETGPNAKARLRKQVADRLKTIQSRCEGPLQLIAEAVPQMLEIDEKKRPTAEQLVRRLKPIGQAPQPPTPVVSFESLEPSARASFPSGLTYSSESDSDFGPVININVQRPTE
ncbi:positive regulation of MDA-5 signaling pathway [Ascochyta clinopodiicola]|nr:positive regulation of MDA-5 signaling pathway [Ascochyta clinopodiicola]